MLHHILTDPIREQCSALRCLNDKDIIDEVVSLRGWARSVRKQGKRVFIEFDDGTTSTKLQLVGLKDKFNTLPINGCGIFVIGKIVKSPGVGQAIEVQIEACKVFPHDTSTPLSKAALSMEYLRNIPHLRMKNKTMGVIMRIRSQTTMLTHMFFDQMDFIHMRTPIISTGDCEGAGKSFIVTASTDVKAKNKVSIIGPGLIQTTPDSKAKQFFGQDVGLVVSGQLHGECGAQALSNIYTFGPTFRAENSHTGRHLAEFDMVEPEAVMESLRENIRLAFQYFVFCIRGILQCNLSDIMFLENQAPGLVQKLKTCYSNVDVITYTDAIEILKANGDDIKWGDDLNSVQEKYIIKYKGDIPVFIVQYPAAIKSFYMLKTSNCKPDRQTVECMDFLVPGVGELIGGSMRVHDYDELINTMTEKGMDLEQYQWYADIRRFGGLPTGGFGLGFERLIMFLTGAHIRDCIPFPRFPGKINA